MTEPRLRRKAKEIKQLADEIYKKMSLMESILTPVVEGRAFPVQFECEETVNFHKLRIRSGDNNGVHGYIYFPKLLRIQPEKLELVRGKDPG